LTAVPEPADVLLYGIQERVGTGVVFESTYDFDGALQLRGLPFGPQRLIGQGRTRFEKEHAVMTWFGETPVPYDHLYAYDASIGLFERLPDQRAGNEFLSGYAARQQALAAAR